MSRTRHSLLGLALVLLPLAGCAGGTAVPAAARIDPTVITRAQLVERQFLTAYDAVRTLRSHWLAIRDVDDTFTTPSQMQVYLDDVRLGGVGTLRDIQATSVMSITYIDGIRAASRWGHGHDRGVILVATR